MRALPVVVALVSLALAGCHRDQPAPSKEDTPAPHRPRRERPKRGPRSKDHEKPAPTKEASKGEEVTFMSGTLKLEGHLWVPQGAGPFRAIVWNHGSEKDPGDGALLGPFFNAKGLAAFFPHRRGHGKSEGQYEGDLVQAAPQPQKNQVMVAELTKQVDDVMAALEYLKTRGEVRHDAFALAGCSYGGIMTLLTSERPSAFKVAVDFAGASESWAGNDLLRARLTTAVDHATIPIFFLQAENDYNTTPSKALSAEMDKVKKPNKMKIYPPFGTTPQEGHGGFCTKGGDVWGDDVMAWINQYLPAAAPAPSPSAAPSASAPPPPAAH